MSRQRHSGAVALVHYKPPSGSGGAGGARQCFSTGNSRVDLKQKVRVRLTAVFSQLHTARFCFAGIGSRTRSAGSVSSLDHESKEKSLVEMVDNVWNISFTRSRSFVSCDVVRLT